MSRSQTEEAAKDLGKTVGRDDPAAEQSAREPQEESLKHHGDELQNAVDKATGTSPTQH